MSLRALKDTFSIQFPPSALCIFQIWVSLGESVSELMVPVQPPCAAAQAEGHSVTVQQGEKAQPGCKETKGKKQITWIKSFIVQLPSLWTPPPTFYTPKVIYERSTGGSAPHHQESNVLLASFCIEHPPVLFASLSEAAQHRKLG